MSQDLSFRRKVIYVVIIAALLYPLFRLGQPSTKTSPGGKLAQLRAAYHISQAQLGDIDPAGESMKLATFGLRNLAATKLWLKSMEYKKVEDWEKMSAALTQITKLQPNFIAVWESQAHNISYNVSVEFDDYRQRYHWVKKGINFLNEGVQYNYDNPRLLHQTGWFVGQKMGRADEHVFFRRMFRADRDFHDELDRAVPVDEGKGYDGQPDNWLVGRLWYLRAYEAVDRGVPLRGKSPLIFRADGPMSFINYGTTIEEEGILGQTAQRAWEKAAVGWLEFGRRQIPTSWGHNLRLGDLPTVNSEAKELRRRLDEVTGNLRDVVRQEKVDKLPKAEREALALPVEKIEESTYQARLNAESKTQVTHRDVAERVPAERRDQAIQLAVKLTEREEMQRRIAQYRNIVNYDYWEIRCASEKTSTAIDARETLFDARKAYDAAELEKARRLYEQSWKNWASVFEKNPRLRDDLTAEDLKDEMKRYLRLLQQLDLKLPADFPLPDVLKKVEEARAAEQHPEAKKSPAAKP